MDRATIHERTIALARVFFAVALQAGELGNQQIDIYFHGGPPPSGGATKP